MMPRGGVWRTVSVQRSVLTKDAAGGEIDTFQEVKSRQMMVKPLTGRELFRAQQVDPEIDYEFWVRYDEQGSGVTIIITAHILVFDSRTFGIKAVLNEGERDRWHRILATEKR